MDESEKPRITTWDVVKAASAVNKMMAWHKAATEIDLCVIDALCMHKTGVMTKYVVQKQSQPNGLYGTLPVEDQPDVPDDLSDVVMTDELRDVIREAIKSWMQAKSDAARLEARLLGVDT